MNSIEESMKVVTDAIRNDSGYREGWKANIAMAFKDEYANQDEHDKIHSYGHIHQRANKAADRFLDILLGDGKEKLPDGSSFFIASI